MCLPFRKSGLRKFGGAEKAETPTNYRVFANSHRGFGAARCERRFNSVVHFAVLTSLVGICDIKGCRFKELH
jgi:hypothetical protein